MPDVSGLVIEIALPLVLLKRSLEDEREKIGSWRPAPKTNNIVSRYAVR